MVNAKHATTQSLDQSITPSKAYENGEFGHDYNDDDDSRARALAYSSFQSHTLAVPRSSSLPSESATSWSFKLDDVVDARSFSVRLPLARPDKSSAARLLVNQPR